MMAAMPIIDSDLGQVDDESLTKARTERLQRISQGLGAKPAHPERIRIRNDALALYAPDFIRKRLEVDEMIFLVNPLDTMSKSAAKGIMEAQAMGYYDTPEGQRAWARSISRLWMQIVATAKK